MDILDEETKQRELVEMTSVLANERTYAAWVRTGLAALATALGIETFLGEIIALSIIRIISIILIFFSGLCFFIAAWRYNKVGKHLSTSRFSGAPVSLVLFFSGLLVFVSCLAMLGLWLK